MVLLNKCLISPWIKGEKRIPLNPSTVLGLTPKLLKSSPNLISTQNTTQIISTKRIGYPITPGEKTKDSEDCFNMNVLNNYSYKKASNFGCTDKLSFKYKLPACIFKPCWNWKLSGYYIAIESWTRIILKPYSNMGRVKQAFFHSFNATWHFPSRQISNFVKWTNL